MATPKTLKPISKEQADEIISKHLKAKTGEYEYGDVGDFIYKQGRKLMLIREGFGNRYEIGEVVQ